jgi:hypothetical protein
MININESEIIRDREVMRLVDLSRNNGLDNLLSAALDNRETNPASVAKLHSFVRRHIGEGNAEKKYWAACSAFLVNSGMSAKELEEVRNPPPVPGTPGFKSILDELEEEGRT